MNLNSILRLYKGGSVGLLLTGAAQIWLGLKGDPALFATGVATIAGAVVPAVSAKRLDGQIKNDVFTPTSPVDAITNGLNEILSKKQSAEADLAKAKQAAEAITGVVLGPDAREALSKII